MVPADSHRISRVRATQDTTRLIQWLFVYGTITLYGLLSKRFHLNLMPHRSPTTPICLNIMVWAIPRSLATTWGIIIIFFSCGYLDVSVPCVSLLKADDMVFKYWVAPFGNPRIKGYLHLPEAYRSLSRPSSPPRAKASAIALAYFLTKYNNISLYMRQRMVDIYFQLFTFFCTSCQRSF
jgi:hypothetical protein